MTNRGAVTTWKRIAARSYLSTIMVSGYATNTTGPINLGTGLQRFYERIEPLLRSPKMGPILWQLPPNFQRNDERLRDALARFPKEQRHCIEFRHPTWFVEETYEALREHGVALVIGDRPEVK